MNANISDDLLRFIRKMVVDTKHYIVAEQGGILGHAKFDENNPLTIKRKGHDIAMIDSGRMVSSITCDVDFNEDTFDITVNSPVEYSSYAQLENRNWDFLKITPEELNYYAQQIAGNLYVR